VLGCDPQKERESMITYYPSRLRSYLECGERYRRRYIEKDRRDKTNIALAIGNALHHSAEKDNKKKIETPDDLLSKENIVDIAVEDYKKITSENPLDEPATEIGKGIDSCADGAGVYADEVSPNTRPILAEEKIFTKVKGEDGKTFRIAGIIDIAEIETVGDFKTGKTAWNQKKADSADQLTLYGLLYHSKYGEFPKKMWIANLINRVKGWKHQHLETTRNLSQYQKLLRRLSIADAGIRKGTFLPAAEGSWKCSEKWCEFWTDCIYAQGK